MGSESGEPVRHRQLLTAGLRPAVLAVAAALVLTHHGAAQRAYEGVAGGLYGASTGALLGMAGSFVPCSQSAAGSSCIAWGMANGAAIGGVSGLALALDDIHRLDGRFRGSAVGLAIGSAVGFGISRAGQRFGIMDVLTVGAFGAAIGSAPKGAGAGLLVGSAVGVGVHLAGPGLSLPNFAGFALAGLAAGALVDWVLDAASSSTNPSDSGLRITFRATI